MDKVGLKIWLEIVSFELSWLAFGVSLSNFCSFEICFVKIYCQSHNPWSKKCVGRKELLEGTLQCQGIGCILLFIFVIQQYISFP
jgi:hypothetical protein